MKAQKCACFRVHFHIVPTHYIIMVKGLFTAKCLLLVLAMYVFTAIVLPTPLDRRGHPGGPLHHHLLQPSRVQVPPRTPVGHGPQPGTLRAESREASLLQGCPLREVPLYTYMYMYIWHIRMEGSRTGVGQPNIRYLKLEYAYRLSI